MVVVDFYFVIHRLCIHVISLYFTSASIIIITALLNIITL